MPQLSKEELMLKERKVKALEKIANVLDALTLWFEDIDKEEAEKVKKQLEDVGGTVELK